jgi:hypothetical protein
MTGGFTEDEALSLIAKMTKPNSEWSPLWNWEKATPKD